MKKLDWMIQESHRRLDEMKHRTEVENRAAMLMAEGKAEKALELIKTLDDSLLEIREWPGEEMDKEDEK